MMAPPTLIASIYGMNIHLPGGFSGGDFLTFVVRYRLYAGYCCRHAVVFPPQALDLIPQREYLEVTYSYRFVFITALFVTCILAANILIVKQISVAGITLPAAIVIFPLSYIFGDVLTEVYGYSQARRVIWLGFFCNLLLVTAIWSGKITIAAGSVIPATDICLTMRILAASMQVTKRALMDTNL